MELGIIVKDNGIYDGDRPLAFFGKEKCNFCGEVKETVEIDASAWEYGGAIICHDCLKWIAHQLNAKSSSKSA